MKASMKGPNLQQVSRKGRVRGTKVLITVDYCGTELTYIHSTSPERLKRLRVAEIKKQFEANPPLIYRIVDAIVASPIEEERKLQALEDLLDMYSTGYMEPTPLKEQVICEPDWDSIASHHVWDKSKLGHDFWDTLNQIIGYV